MHPPRCGETITISLNYLRRHQPFYNNELTLRQSDTNQDAHFIANSSHNFIIFPRAMKEISRLIVIVTFLLAAIRGNSASGKSKYSIQDSIQVELARATTVKDSIRLLYDLYDAVPRAKKYAYSKKLTEIAKRINNEDIQLDLLRNNANLYLSSDSMLTVFENEARSMPSSDNQKATVLFIKLLNLATRTKMASAEERRDIVQGLIEEYNASTDNDLYAQVERLYSLCVCISFFTEGGDMYNKYLGELEELMTKLPDDEGNAALKTMFFTRQAILSTMKNNHKKAIQADNRILDNLKILKKKYETMGRRYKDYDVSEYVCRLRLLNNFEGLPIQEVERNYARIMELAASNSDVMQDVKTNERAELFYLMAKKEYDKALTIMKRHPETMHDQRYRPFYMRFMITAAKETGDKDTHMQALQDYCDYLEECLAVETDSKTQELRIMYDVESLRRQSMELQRENLTLEKETNKNIIIGVSAVAILLVIFLICVTRMYYRQKNLISALAESENKLQAEKLSLISAKHEISNAYEEAENANRLKTQFIQNMRHEILTPLNAIVGFSQLIADSIPGEKREEMEKYTNIIAENNEILHTVVTDIIDIAQLETGEMKVSYRPVSLNEICINTITTVSRKVAQGVKMYFDAPKEDLMIYTDRIRVEQVITNFLNNAAKFTTKGSIVLSYAISNDKSNVILSVTDTGAGIPADKQEAIFERFVKLNPYSSGTGVGLHICRLIAGILHGSVKVDPTYTSGARFLFILPLKPPTDKNNTFA